MYSGKNSTKRPAARPVLPWRRKMYSTGIDKSGYCSVAQWLSDEEDRLTTKTTYDSICPKAKDADEEGGDDAEEPASMGHCTHYSGMATARCRRKRRNGVGRWSGRVTIMQGGMAEQQKGTDDAMMQRLQPSQVMTRELQLTQPALWCEKRCMWLCAFTVACTASRRRGGRRMELRLPNLSVRNLQVCKVPSLFLLILPRP